MPISFAEGFDCGLFRCIESTHKSECKSLHRSLCSRERERPSLSGNCWIIRLSDFFPPPAPRQSDFLRKLLRGWHKSTHTTTSPLAFFEVSVKNELRWQHRKNPSSVIWKMIWIPVILAARPPSTQAAGNFKRWRWCITFVTWLWLRPLTSLSIRLHSNVPSVACLTASSLSPPLYWNFKWELLSCSNRIWQKIISLTFQLDYFPSWK